MKALFLSSLLFATQVSALEVNCVLSPKEKGLDRGEVTLKEITNGSMVYQDNASVITTKLIRKKNISESVATYSAWSITDTFIKVKIQESFLAGKIEVSSITVEFQDIDSAAPLVRTQFLCEKKQE